MQFIINSYPIYSHTDPVVNGSAGRWINRPIGRGEDAGQGTRSGDGYRVYVRLRVIPAQALWRSHIFPSPLVGEGSTGLIYNVYLR